MKTNIKLVTIPWKGKLLILYFRDIKNVDIAAVTRTVKLMRKAEDRKNSLNTIYYY